MDGIDAPRLSPLAAFIPIDRPRREMTDSVQAEAAESDNLRFHG
jgi:hypothetical protein